MARITNAQVFAALATLTERLDALTPAVSAPAQTKAESPFVAFLHERAASRIPCEIASHKGQCNRSFTPASSGRTNHVARIV